MNIPDNIIKQKLKNVYFIWGRGKTTIANALHKKYGFYVYSTDDSREWHIKNANPRDQPYMCRDFEKEYVVKSFWELPKEVIIEREKNFLTEVTPMIIADLIVLSSQYKAVICEGDIDYETVTPVASYAVHLNNCGKSFDWFNRPDHANIIDIVNSRTDLFEKEKENLINNAYDAVAQNEGMIPDWVVKYGIKNISWDDNISQEETANEVADFFGFSFL